MERRVRRHDAWALSSKGMINMQVISYVVKQVTSKSESDPKLSLFIAWTKTDNIEEAKSIAHKKLDSLGWTIEKPFDLDDLPNDSEDNSEETETGVDAFADFIKDAEEKGSSFALIEMHEQEKE